MKNVVGRGSHFEGLLDGYFEKALAEHPMQAAVAGWPEGEGKLGRAGLEFEEREHRRRARTLAGLEGLSPRDLTAEQHLDRLALRSLLVRENEEFERGRHRLDPTAIDQVLGILLHELQRGETDRKRAVGNIRSILRETPRFLAAEASMVDAPEPVWKRIMLQTAEAAPVFLKAVGQFLESGPAEDRDVSDIAEVQRAFDRYRDDVANLEEAPAGTFAVGSGTLQRRVRDELGLDYTLGQIEALAEQEVARIGGLLSLACRKFGPKKTAHEIIEEARESWEPKEELLDLYRKTTQTMSDRFREASAVTFPQGDLLVVRPVPEFMRHLFPTAAYSAPGAFEKVQRGTFWVNDLSVTKTSAVEKKAERSQHFGLTLTCAHEAYPGHHLQFVTANQHPRRWRRLFAHAIFYEGWTLWCEQMMVDLRLDRSPWLKVQQLHDALWRCHRILVDVRLQTARYSYDRAVKHMQTHLGFTKARAQADVNWYTGQPAVPMSYWLGRLENERLQRRLMGGRGWDLRRFNDWLLSFGTLPQGWLEKYGLD